MALKGNLKDFSFLQLLNLINLANKTGTLTLKNQVPQPDRISQWQTSFC